MRKTVHLNFGWKFCENFEAAMIEKNYDDSMFETVNIPHANKELPYNYFDEKIYQFVSCYRKIINVEKEDKEVGKRINLHFEGAANKTDVYINGVFVGEYKGGYAPFEFDITDFVIEGENLLCVKLDSRELKEIPPFGNVIDYLCYGGIYREVRLEIVDEIYIENVFVRTRNVLLEQKILDIDVTFSKSAAGDINFALYDGKNLLKEHSCAFNAKILNVKWRAENVQLWDIDDEKPKLYTLKVSLPGGDETEVKFGFREARFTKNGFIFNGRNVKLIGLNRHQSYPYVGYAMPASAQKADAELLKFKLGCNLVRTAHYMNSKHFLERCDEIGLLVFTEAPSWQFTGEGEWRENYIEAIKKMVVRDRNHPSVILWGVRVNEGMDCDELYEITNRTAHTLDSTRQTGGVRNFPRSHLLEDVYTYNDFSHSGGGSKLLPPFIVSGFQAPYLVTEYNGHMYPTKSFDREEIRTEHALRHARVQNKAHGNTRTSGAIGWCMADYNTHKDFGSGDRICYHGVTDMFRIAKPAAALYASQQDRYPVMEVSSSMDIGEHPAAKIGQVYIFTNCDFVKVYKNGVHVSTAYPDKKQFGNLPHPPVLPFDYIGDALTRDEGFDDKTSKYVKAALLAAVENGFVMPVQNYIKLLFGMLHGSLSVKQVYDLVMKYVANWGNSQLEYKFEGYKNGEMVKTVVKTAVTSASLKVCADSNTLVHGETYDVTRIELEAVDQNGNRLPFASNSISVNVGGAAEIAGPESFSLIGGVRAFWIKTNGADGKISIKIAAENMGEQVLELKAVKQ